ncbi:hypothetical protein CY34DRAFT_100723 [Suillus luteus UH-Slu-Lm8-n1]|uniref:Uncharacterized protein n=1 Tax=Suillus luteus UH-Slu-Lm8-n1 TaxID=930992 RepID=A0A0D0AF16_9AGAM|nr:hypothetical protein CY34DRAFT_100723 [Suillus luteus UH-Slu-Lm8-n1]
MSDVPPTTPFMKPEWVSFCGECGDELAWRMVSSSKNDNRGRWYAMCSKKTPAGKPEFFRWGSPKSSPNQSPPDLSLTLHSGSLLPIAVPDASSNTQGYCAVLGCKSCRVAVGCEHQCCRKHCLAFGGCHLKKHKLSPAERQRFAAIDPALLVPPNPHHRNSMTPSDTPDSIQPTPDLETRAPTPILPHKRSYATLPPTSTTPATTRESSAGPSKLPVTRTKKGKAHAVEDVDMLAHSRHPSQLPPVFTQRYAEQELILQQQKTREAEQRDLARCAANTIHAYGWSKDGNEAKMFEVQNGFTYPQLRMTASILSALGLTAGEDGSSMLQYYNTARSRWINIIQGHVITLDMHHIFLRNIGVSVMPDFDTIFHGCDASEAGVPNIRTNLQAERTAVRNANNRDLLKLASSKRLGSVIELSSGSDDEVIAPGKRKTAARRQDQHGPTRRIRTNTGGSSHPPTIMVEHSLGTIELTSDDSDDSLLTTGRLFPSPTGLTAGDPIDVDSFILKRTWPRSFYTCEVADVFEAAAVDDGRSLKMKFKDVYGPDVRFYASTFSDHLKRWKAAPPSSRSEFIEAGKTDDGLYSRFMKANPAPGGEVKAAKKCLARLRG